MRISFKMVNSLMNTLDSSYQIRKMKWLGNRKDYYYEYTLYNNNEVVLKTESLKEIYNYLIIIGNN